MIRHPDPLYGTRPTSAERAALAALCRPGSSEALAAHDLGMTRHALSKRLQRLYRRLGVNSAAQAAWIIRDPDEGAK